MSSDSKCKQLTEVCTIANECSTSAGRRVINLFLRSANPALKAIGVLAEIVEQACNVAERAGAEFRRMTSGRLRDRFEMKLEGLPIVPT